MEVQAETARIAVASNFKTTIEALESAFEAAAPYEIETTIGSTGVLYAQIVQGAPFDVFLAADQERPARLAQNGRAVADSRFTFAVGALTLWSRDPDTDPLSALSRGGFRRLAMANPKLAPYGAAAQQVISGLGLEATVEGRVVMGENVGQTFAYTHTRNADLGFVALSQVLSLPKKDRGARWDPPLASYDPIRQDAVVLPGGAANPAAIAFVEFLKSPEASAILKRHGYGRQ